MAQAAPIREHYYLGQTTDLVIDTLLGTNEVDATTLAEALIAMARQWRADRQVFSVAVIQAFGAVVRATEELFEVGKPPINAITGLPFSVDPAVHDTVRRIVDESPAMIALRAAHDELRRIVDEEGEIVHRNRANQLREAINQLGGDGYWQRNPYHEPSHKIIIKVVANEED